MGAAQHIAHAASRRARAAATTHYKILSRHKKAPPVE